MTILLTIVATNELKNINIKQTSAIEKQKKSELEMQIKKTNKIFVKGINNRKSLLDKNAKIINNYLKEKQISKKYSIYFIDLNDPEVIYKHNENTRFYPASIYKIPLSMVVLKQIENNKFKLTDTVLHEKKFKTIDKVIEVMIKESNNDSMASLENKLGGYDSTEKLIKNDLGVEVKRRGQITNAKEIAKTFIKLYPNHENSYLGREMNEYLLNYMKNPIKRLQDRIPAAIENYNSKNQVKLTVANKIGTLDGVYQDAAIIFGENSDYVLVIMNKQRLTNEAVDEIDFITNTLLTNLETN